MILNCFTYRVVQKIFSASKLILEIVKMSTSDFPKSSKDSLDEDELDPERVRLQNKLLNFIYILIL